jgi:HAD superfamily hydrolase (TIGR01662 family)
MPLKAVLFDLDETLLDWSNFNLDWRAKEAYHLAGVYDFVTAHGAGLNATPEVLQEHFSRRVRDAWASARATLRSPHIGKLLVESLTHFGMVPDDTLTMDACLEAYAWGAIEGVTVFPDVPETLETLNAHGILVGIVTNAFQPITMRDRELADYDLLRYFPHAPGRICAADVGYLKPHPYIFQHALKALDVDAAEAVFVGDNVVADISGAQKVGMKAVLRVNDSNEPLATMIRPDASVRHLGELLTTLDEWFPGWR